MHTDGDSRDESTDSDSGCEIGTYSLIYYRTDQSLLVLHFTVRISHHQVQAIRDRSFRIDPYSYVRRFIHHIIP